ncbi:MAG: hypothetical protein AMK73_07260 [Planctomycetes bacterium SM23_32]|nr:MAG: hypothetical protein AMK73_07260 [Planctomycetes bacterium SM23_32]
MRLKVVACGVFEEELRAAAAGSANEVEVELLDAGLHAVPETLRLRAQQAIDAASDARRYDAVCLSYGLCGRGTAGLISRELPLVIPRVHDCIAVFLGSAGAYAEQFARHPGTFYFTTGWYRHKAHPERTRMAAARRFDATTHPHYAELSRRYGRESARYVVEFLESWRRNYSRAALIDHGFATAEHEEMTRAVAEAAGWDYERLPGSMALLEGLLAGEWDEAEFLLVPPGLMVVPTNDERILAAVPAPEGSDVTGVLTAVDTTQGIATGTFFYGEHAEDAGQADLGLGIDAGGTYTDAVVYDLRGGALLCKAKALTTPYDLVEGIRNALGGLDGSLFGRVSYACLSTTLATNAIVEGRGLPVGLVLMPYHEAVAARVKTPLFRCIGARMNIQGLEERPVDEGEVRRAAEELAAEGAAAFAVSGYGSVRNPAHELRVKEMLQAERGLPVVCGHELSGRLNFVERAHTAVLNARLLPLIGELLRSVEDVLGEAGVAGPLFVVRGDGGIMHRDVGRARAVETVLSGPAASAVGGRVLTCHRDALVVDIGGTTTDIAVLREGRIAISPEGARVGHWRTSVAAADIQTTGLGGDSAVRPAGRRRVRLGPDRAVPLALVAAGWPGVRDELAELAAEQVQGTLTPELLDFFVLAGRAAGLALDGAERRIVELLSERPRSRSALARACGCAGPQLLRVGRLEGIGLVRRAGVTPTDALHVLGEYRAFDEEAARAGLGLLAGFLDCPAEQAALIVKHEVERQLALAVARRELSADDLPFERFEDVRALLERALDGQEDAPSAEGPPFRLRWEQVRPVVGIGAPAAAFLTGACRLLGTTAVVPPDADVANAVGAATARVVVCERVRVRPAEFGGYVLYGPDGREDFARLPDAESAARRRVVDAVRRKAQRFGTAEQQVRVEVSRLVGRLQDGSAQLLEIEVAGSLAGAPLVPAHTGRGT